MDNTAKAALALLFATANAMKQTEGSYYEVEGDDQADSIADLFPDEQKLYNYYYYYGYEGQTVAAIIFLDILLPIACCIGIIVTIVCVMKHVRRRRMAEAQHAHEQHR